MQVVLASHNQGKLKEFQLLFQGVEVEVVPQSALQVPPAEETGCTFVENAILKARNACIYTNLPAIADDSGLAVDALGGQPGIYSARFAGKDVSHRAHIEKLLSELSDVPDVKRTARFHCVLVYMRHAKDPSPLIAHGVWEGRILQEPVGCDGFGYDPVFFVPDKGCSAAELPFEKKARCSHRALAMRELHRMLGIGG